MRMAQSGGCLCGVIRYAVTAEPVRVTICHCTFCKKITGSAYLVEPVFRKEDVSFSGAIPKAFVHRADTSRRKVTVNFCGTCATKIYLDLARFPDIWGLFEGRLTIRTGSIVRLQTAVISSHDRLNTALSSQPASTPSRPTPCKSMARQTRLPCSCTTCWFPGVSRTSSLESHKAT